MRGWALLLVPVPGEARRDGRPASCVWHRFLSVNGKGSVRELIAFVFLVLDERPMLSASSV